MASNYQTVFELIKEQCASKRHVARRTNLYLIGTVGHDFYKIGITVHRPIDRLKGMQSGCPLPLDLLRETQATRTTEQNLHLMLRRYSVHGEWFRFNEAQLAQVLAIFDDERLFCLGYQLYDIELELSPGDAKGWNAEAPFGSSHFEERYLFYSRLTDEAHLLHKKLAGLTPTDVITAGIKL